MKLNTKYDLFQIVYLVTDKDQEDRMITEIQIQPGGVMYQLSQGASFSVHWEQEITAVKDKMKSLV